MNGLLILILVALAVAAMIQLVRLNEVASEARGGHSEENITRGENNAMAAGWIIFMVLFFGFLIWLMAEFGYGGLGPAGSVHGEELDWLLKLNYWIILPVFFITNSVLFIFAWKYRYDPNRKATFFSHSNKLELIWTIVPSCALAVIIILGLRTWIDITMNSHEEGDPMIVEVYAKQFGWEFRLSGADNELGASDYKLIFSGDETIKDQNGNEVTVSGNGLGVVTYNSVMARKQNIDNRIHAIDSIIETKKGADGEYWASTKQVEGMLKERETLVVLKSRIVNTWERRYAQDTTGKEPGNDDHVTGDALYLIKDRPVTMKFRSRDVIHSAWMPHFRAQMNCVPGEPTQFTFTPKYTTEEFKNIPEVQEHYKNLGELRNKRLRSLGLEEELVEFDFILLCNKICGAGHSNMQNKIVVVTEEEYEKWYECTDFDGKCETPRLDFSGKPMVYKGWRDEAKANDTNMAEEKAKLASNE